MVEVLEFIEEAIVSTVENSIQQKRFKRFESYLTEHDFDTLFYRIILEHITEDDYPIPNNKLMFIIDYVKKNGRLINPKKLKINQENIILLFRDFYFQMIDFEYYETIRIYNKPDMRLLIEI